MKLWLSQIFSFVAMVSGSSYLYFNQKIDDSTNIFRSYKTNPGLTDVLATFPYTTFENCASNILCAFFCQSNDNCILHHYDKTHRECKILDTSMAAVKEDGIYSCIAPFNTYGDSTEKFCMKNIFEWSTRAQASSRCAGIGGNVAILRESLKHVAAADISQAIYDESHRAVWIDATMNTTSKTWYWSDGTIVPESRFHGNDLILRPTNKPCVSFLGKIYTANACSLTGSVLCDRKLSMLFRREA